MYQQLRYEPEAIIEVEYDDAEWAYKRGEWLGMTGLGMGSMVMLAMKTAKKGPRSRFRLVDRAFLDVFVVVIGCVVLSSWRKADGLDCGGGWRLGRAVMVVERLMLWSVGVAL